MSKRTFRIVNRSIFGLVIIGAYLFIGRVGYDAISLRIGDPLTGVPTGEYSDVKFPARGQRYDVYAFLLHGDPGAPVLISVHGYRGSRHDQYHLDRAAALRALGYTVLSIDLSDNAGDTIGDGRMGMGYAERWDVLGGFDYLITQGFSPDSIGLVGESMGGTTALLAAAIEPRIHAVWSDSAYARADTVVGERLMSAGMPTLIVPGGLLWGWLLAGDRIWEAAPISAGATFAVNRQAVYLVHCEKDSTVPFHHGVDLFTAYHAAGVNVTFWDVPDLEHVSAFIYRRAEYMQRLDTFFRQNLSSDL